MLKSKTEQRRRSNLCRQQEYDRTHPVSELFSKLREKYGNKCVISGCLAPLEFAHIKPTKLSGEGRGQKVRYYDIKNNPDCYVLMTTNCHREFDEVSSELKEEWLLKNRKF
jgi:hypothetical protein